ncbi:TonB-dependent receptor [Sulfurimonas gotlandica GD1]|uniref:TonB-dependent receptor n=1 Tax=Sulfurimonas gotlandica (strain DSM 19862 / JCM 16533 / GD1) TaxID=929558 RepID=B6BH81_SULGG|nr:TonB-dependent receptor [Sulfurimonas gotlandica]EDZ63451.1 TonB-dependent receptor [Sulfurimonas gotlandica GD1]EHP29870.1 TonB-dependent receptor [Sulfurimonas gotlandica GD1]
MQNTIKFSIILVAFLSSLHATDAKTVVLEPLSITSTAIKTDELKSTDAVEIYTQKDIEKAHVRNVYEFLNSQTSVITMPGYGNPFAQKIDMRGFGITDGYQNIVINVNGRRLNNVDMVSQLLSSISPASISRIEIIKSSGIVVGGDGANAGVINITTKKSNDKEFTIYGGSYGTFDGSFYLGHKGDKLAISASGEAQKNDGIRNIDSAGNKDESKLTTGTFNLLYNPIEALELRAGATSARTKMIYASGLTEAQYNDDPTQKGAYSVKQSYDTDAFNAGLGYDISDKLNFNADATRENKKSKYGTSNPAYYVYDSIKAKINYESDFLKLSVGYDNYNNDRTSATNEITKRNNAGYIMSNFELGNSVIKAGYRYEKVSFESRGGDNQDDTLHGAELGYNYSYDKEKSLFINYAHSYQSADLDRLFNWTTGAFTGYVNPAQANNYSIGFNHIVSNNKFKISAFYIDLKDEIYYHKTGPWTGDNTNIDKSHKYGLDIYDKWLITEKWNIALNYNYIQAIIDEEKEGSDNYAGNHLPGVSDHNIKATLGFLPNKFSTISVTQVYRSETYAADDFNNNFSQKQDAYMSTDISATYTMKSWEVFAKINNLFNQKNGLWIENDNIYPINFTRTAIVGFKLKY